jgi:hypothetical protein
VFTNHELDILLAATMLIHETTSEGMQAVNVVRGKLESMRTIERTVTSDARSDTGTPAESQTV